MMRVEPSIGSVKQERPPQNPWERNRKPSGEGPPDLEQLIKQWQQKWMGLFKGKGGGRGMQPPHQSTGSNGTEGLGPFFSLLAIGGLILYLVSGIYIVQPAERAVITRFGAYVRTESPGLHWLPALIEKQTKVNVERRETTKHNGAMLTEDENIVNVDIAVQYRIKDAKAYLFNVINPIRTLSEATESALRQVIGQSKLDDVLTSGRASIANAIKTQLVETMESYGSGIEIFDVTMQPAKAPEEVRAAFDDVIKAREEHESLVYNAQAYANDILPKAKGQAERLLQEAEGYKAEMSLVASGAAERFDLILPAYQKAPDITKKRLYLETLEQVFSNTPKVIMETDKGQPLVYLPLDKLMGNKGTLPEAPVVTQTSPQPDKVEVPAVENKVIRVNTARTMPVRRQINNME